MSRLFSKYTVTKNDGSLVDPNAQYFVLRIDTDPVARKAALRYSSYISQSDPEFADEIFQWVMQYEQAVEHTLAPDAATPCAHRYHAEDDSNFICIDCGSKTPRR